MGTHAGTGIGWANAGADIALPATRLGRLVARIPLVLLITPAACQVNTCVADHPIIAIRDMLPTWMAVPYPITAWRAVVNNPSVT